MRLQSLPFRVLQARPGVAAEASPGLHQQCGEGLSAWAAFRLGELQRPAENSHGLHDECRCLSLGDSGACLGLSAAFSGTILAPGDVIDG